MVKSLLATCFMLVSCSVYSLTLKKEVPIDFQWNTNVISQKKELFITTTVRTSNPT
jgi:hypothetical protein